MAALASNGNGSTEKVEKAMENMSVNEPGAKAPETVIGIDLGTTFSCVAVWDEAEGRPVVLTNASGAKTMPSYVSFTEQARVVGQPAKSQAASNPANTVYDVKRIIGRSWNDQVCKGNAFECCTTIVLIVGGCWAVEATSSLHGSLFGPTGC